jgi:hypothetical protein
MKTAIKNTILLGAKVNLMDSEARSVTVKPRERAEGSQP